MSCQGVRVVMVLVASAVACGEPPSVVVQPLRIVNWSPGSGAVCVDPGTRILVTFSDDILLDTLTAENFQLLDSGGGVGGTIGYDKPTFTASLAPATTLDWARLYTVTVKRAVSSSEQGTLPVDVSSSFMTVARVGCTPGPQCQLPSDCPENQLCSSVGVCIEECVTSRDCPGGGACSAGKCL